MRPSENIENAVKKINFTAGAKLREQILADALKAHEQTETQPAFEKPNRWRIIMKSKITKLAAAAVIVIAVMVSITFLDKSVAPAYALEQTIEALKNARIVHMFCRDWDGKAFEMWMSLNAEGYPEYCYSYWPDYEITNISTPTVSYQYNKKMNRVSVNKGQLYEFNVQFDRMFENLQKAAEENEGGLKIYRQADSSREKNLIVVTSEGNKDTEWKIYIDPASKLPVGIHCLKSNQPGQFIRDFDEIRFDEELPAGIFEFEVPEGAIVENVDQNMQLLDDANYGISAEGLTKQQAAEEIAREYWQAIINRDLEKANKLYPSTNVSYSVEEVEKRYHRYFGDYLPSRFVESGKLYVEHNCGLGEVLPCILMFENGRKKEVKIIIRFRNIEGTSSCVIAGHWGYPVEIN